ncbi:MAG: hypothetical protein JXN61_01835 [Sedimentisphaerales bacterium]|nr:hypothetical protein [Sedimentisphaerales bacterium]
MKIKRMIRALVEVGLDRALLCKIRRFAGLYVGIILCFLCLVIMTSCNPMKFDGVKPVYPKPNADFNEYPKVVSLRPTFEWKALKSKKLGNPDMYQISIWEQLLEYNSSTRNEAIIMCQCTKETLVRARYVTVRASAPKRTVTMAHREPVYRENVQGLSHKIDISLKPSTRYLWSVRPGWVKEGENIHYGGWGHYESRAEHRQLAREISYFYRCRFPFVTPLVDPDAKDSNLP